MRASSQSVDCGDLLGVRTGGVTQPMDGFVVRVGQARQRIVIS